MRKHHNKLFFKKYTDKAVFDMPYSPWLYPTTDWHLESVITKPDALEGKILNNNFFNVKKYAKELRTLALFIIENRHKIKFRLQTDTTIIYSDRNTIKEVIKMFFDQWIDHMEVDPYIVKNFDENIRFCKKIPHGKYQYQVYLKQPAYMEYNETDKQALANFLFTNEENTKVANKHMELWLKNENESKYVYFNGYFYVKDERCLSMLYMIAQKYVDRIIKFVKI